MLFSSDREDLQSVKNEVADIFTETGIKPRVLSAENFSIFCKELNYALRLISEEKEIIFFMVLQAAVIVITYMVWVKVLYWIPDTVWAIAIGNVANHMGSDSDSLFISLILYLWSFFILFIASYPISLLSGAMMAAHYLRSTNEPATMGHCFNLASKYIARIWRFTGIDIGMAVYQVVDRVCKKSGSSEVGSKKFSYYAWRVSTVGIIPALLTGKTYSAAAKDAITLIQYNPERAVGIRMGYSLICWMIGIAAYVIFILASVGSSYADHHLYILIVKPLIVTVGVIAIFVRPFFLIMSTRLYCDAVLVDKAITIISPVERSVYVLTFLFAVLLIVLLTSYFFGNQMTVFEWVSSAIVDHLLSFSR